MTWRTWQSAGDGAIRPSTRSAGVYPGAGVARGGQQGRLGIMHGGVGGARSGGRTARASQPASWNTSSWSQQKPTRPTGNLGINQGGGVLGSSQGPPGDNGNDKWIGDGRQPVIATGGVGGAGSTATAYQDPMDQLARFLDSQYWMDLMQAQERRDASVNPLVSEIDSLTRRTDGMTLYDSMLGRAERDHRLVARQSRGLASRQGNLRSGVYDRRVGEMGDAFVDTRLNLLNSHGANRVEQLEAERASAQAAFTREQQMLAIAAAMRRAEQGRDVGDIQFNMQLLGG